MDTITIIFLLFFILVMIFFILEEVFRTGEPLTPWTFFLGFSIIDVFIPSILFIYAGTPNNHPYIPIFSAAELTASTILMAVSTILFGIGYFSISGIKGKQWQNAQILSFFDKVDFAIKRIYLIMIFCGGWVLTSLYVTIKSHGSVAQYLSVKFMRLYGHKIDQPSALQAILTLFEPVMLTSLLMLIAVLFYVRERYNHKILWGIVFPLIGWGFTTTTFLRGTQLVFFLMLFIVEIMKEKEKRALNPILYRLKKQQKKLYRKLLWLFTLALIVFVTYGAIRNFYSHQAQGNSVDANHSILFEAKRFIRGEGIIGVTWVKHNYPDNKEFLWGKTFYDMLLLPVPRFIYTSKPKWYGIADITRGMGGPESTQDAITIVGELLANFGLPGIFLVVIWGGIFGLLFRLRFLPRFRFIYMVLLTPIMFTTLWMAFTGFTNAFKNVPILFLILLLVIRPKYPKRDSLPQKA